MAIAGIWICIGIVIIGILREKKYLNPMTLFGMIWTIVLVCSFTYPRLQTPDEEIYKYIVLGSIFYAIGYLIGTIRKKNIRVVFEKTKIKANVSIYTPRYEIIMLLEIVCILGYIYNLYLVVSGAGSFSAASIKMYLQTFTLQKSGLINAFFFLVIEPLTSALPVIVISNYVYGNRNKKILILAIILILLKTIANSTRNTLIIVLFYFIIGSYEYIKNNKSKQIRILIKKRKKQIIVAILIGILGFVYMTISRGNDLTENLWIDFALPPRLFEMWKEEVDSGNIFGYGFASLQGFIFPIFYIFKNIGGIKLPNNIAIINDIITRTDTTFVWAGKKVTANAYVSIFWFFYLDGRIFGIVIGSFLIGLISAVIYKKFKKNECEYTFTFYCYLLAVIVFSLVRCQFTGVAFALGIVYTLFLYHPNKNRRL